MKCLATLVLLAGALFFTAGCETPGYTANENGRNISRNMNYDLRQTTDDWNDFWLLEHPSRSTRWAVQ